MQNDSPETAPDPLQRRLEDALLGLLAIPSVTGHEAALADHLWRWAEQNPLWPQAGLRRFGNAMVFGHIDERRPNVALVGHLDTVPPAGGDFCLPRVERVDGVRRLVGLGASDMKGGLAVMQVLLSDLAAADLPFAPLMVLYDKEEGAFADNGLEPLLAACPELARLDLAVVMEPTSNRLELGCMGGLQARVLFAGQAAHSARPWQGINAIHRAGPLLVSLLERTPQDVTIDGLTFRNVVSATLARGGRARNVVPDAFEVNLNFRFAPQAGALEAAKSELERLAAGHPFVIDDTSPAGPVPQNNPLLAHWRGLCELAVGPKQAWTDVARLAALGVDAVNFGPGDGAQAHQAGEWIDSDALVESYELLQRLLTSPYALNEPSAAPPG
jgi:succinyl-diaminopimelate desuccinylase